MGQLFVNYFLKDLGQARQDGSRPIAVGVRARAAFEKREDHGRFQVRGENKQTNGPIKQKCNGGSNTVCSYFKKNWDKTHQSQQIYFSKT